MKFAVIGGGITGVSLAWSLARLGERVTLYERSDRVGGLVGSFRIGDVWLEKYFHHIFLSDRAVRSRIADVGLEPELLCRASSMGFYGDGRVHDFNGAPDLLRFSVLPFTDRLRLGLNIFRAGKKKDGLSLDDRTAKEWVETGWSPAIYEKFWGPLLAAKFADAADRISAAWLWGRIFARANSRQGGEKLGYLKGGFLRLLEEMARTIQNKGGELKMRHEVKRVERDSSGRWSVRTETTRDEFDAVVVTIPSPFIPALVPGLPPEEAALHANISYVGVTCMPILMDRPLSHIYWLNVGDRSIPFTGVIEHTNFVPKEEYGGLHVTYLFNYLPPDHPWMSESKDKLFTRYEEGLKKMFPEYRREQVKQILIFRDRHANVIYEKNYLKRMPPIRSKEPGLYFANTAQIFPDDRNMNFSVLLADRVIEEMKRGM